MVLGTNDENFGGNIVGIQIRDRRVKHLMLMMGMNETIDHHLAMTSSVHWYGHVMSREDGIFFAKASDIFM